jgi:hypothetical protein
MTVIKEKIAAIPEAWLTAPIAGGIDLYRPAPVRRTGGVHNIIELHRRAVVEGCPPPAAVIIQAFVGTGELALTVFVVSGPVRKEGTTIAIKLRERTIQ